MGLSKEKAIEMLNSMEAEEVILRTPEQEAEFLKNFKEKEVSSEVSTKFKELHDRYDNDLYEVFGERKQGNEHSYEFLKRKGKAVMSRMKELEAELETAKKNKSEPEEVAQIKKQLKEVQELSEKQKKEWEQEKVKLEMSANEQVVQSVLDTGLVGIDWKSEYDEEVRNTYIRTAQKQLIARAEKVGDQWTFKDENGETLRNQDTLKPMTAKEIQMQMFTKMIKSKKDQPGTGIKPKPDGSSLSVPGNVHTKEQLVKWLIEDRGMVRGSDEYVKAYNEFSVKLEKLN